MTDENVIRIANISGFYGDNLSAARQMVDGGPVDVLTGDYLAELTMAILHNKKMKDENTGYVGTFLKQLKDVVGDCLERNIKIVTNAGGLNPKAMAEEVEKILAEQGLQGKVAWIEGDNLMPRLDELTQAGEPLASIETGQNFADSGRKALTANAYLGLWGIKEALDQGADIVVCPRVTDAVVVMGPAAWKFNWQRDDYDALAGALAAGHIIECGNQATGGNYAFFEEVPSFDNMGYPLAEISADGSFVITKHPGTGGLVSVGTVTAQLVYEINAPAYLNPDVIAHLDTLTLEQIGPDRVRGSGCRGSSPPPSHKVCINSTDGFRNATEMMITGLDIEAKTKLYSDQLFRSLGGRDQFDFVSEQLIRTDKENPVTNDEACATLRIVVESRDPQKVGRMFTAKAVELGLASYPGLFSRTPLVPLGPVIKHWPALIDSKHIVEKVYVNGEVIEVLPTNQLDTFKETAKPAAAELADVPPAPQGELKPIYLGRLFGTRSGDKGGCANLGVWAKTDAAYGYLHQFLTVEKLKELLPDMQQYHIDRYELPNIKSLNFFIRGVLGEGVAATVRNDGQAKSLGEYLRAKLIEAPEELI